MASTSSSTSNFQIRPRSPGRGNPLCTARTTPYRHLRRCPSRIIRLNARCTLCGERCLIAHSHIGKDGSGVNPIPPRPASASLKPRRGSIDQFGGQLSLRPPSPTLTGPPAVLVCPPLLRAIGRHIWITGHLAGACTMGGRARICRSGLLVSVYLGIGMRCCCCRCRRWCRLSQTCGRDHTEQGGGHKRSRQ